jgi:hypothetical protein
MIGIKQLHLPLAHPRVAQPHRYAPVQFSIVAYFSRAEESS